MVEEDCDFCREFAQETTWFQAQLTALGLTDRRLIQRGGVVSLVGLGPLSVGYVLILPEIHYRSLGETPEQVLTEVLSQKQEIEDIMKNLWGKTACFEHGSTRVSHGGACIDHAHLHIVAGDYDLPPHIQPDFAESRISDVRALRRFSEQELPYLYVEDTHGQGYVYNIPRQIPSQYLRRIWARVTGHPDDWDWAVFPNWDLVKETFVSIKQQLNRSESPT